MIWRKRISGNNVDYMMSEDALENCQDEPADGIIKVTDNAGTIIGGWTSEVPKL